MAGADAPVSPRARLTRDLRRHQRGAFVLAAGALILAGALVPRGDELLLIHVRNRDIQRARLVLSDQALHGVSTVSAVVAHSELYLMEGRVDEAVSDLERFVEANPGEAAAWGRLARLYQNAQRLADQIRALAMLYRLEPSDTLARQLAALYRWTGDAAAEAARLYDLVTAGTASTDERLRSARLDAALGHADRAITALERLARTDPGAFEYPELELYASLVVERGQADTLGGRVWRLPLVQQEPEILVQIAAAMRAWGLANQAVHLFAAPPGLQLAPALVAARARTAIDTDAAPHVLQELVARDSTAPLSEDPLSAVFDLALSLGDYDAAASLLANPRRAPAPPIIASVVSHAATHDARPHAQALLAQYGDDVLAESPLLALELATERDDRARALAWIAHIDRAGDSTPAQTVALAQIELRLGVDQQAIARLSRLLDSPHVQAVPASSLRDAYYTLANHGDLALAARAADRLFAASGADADGILKSQALMAVGRREDALAMLADLESADARAAYDVALHQSLLAGTDVTALVRDVFLVRLEDDVLPPDHHRMLVEGLWAVGERATLFDAVSRLAAGDLDTWLAALVETATAAGRLAEAAEIVTNADGGLVALDPKRRQERVRVLIELDASDGIVIPELRRLAYDVGGSWVYAYDERLSLSARISEQVELWTAIGGRATASVTERRAAAARLFDLGAIDRAATVLEALAASAGPADADVRQLTFLWGPRADARQLAWLMNRLRNAPHADQPAWLAYLVGAGGASLLAAEMPALPADSPAALVDAWIDAHRSIGDRAVLRRALEHTLSRTDSGIETLRHVGLIALAEGLTDLVAPAFRAVLARAGDDREARRWLGTLAFYERRTIEARTHLTVYETVGGDEPEPLFQLGELALEAGRSGDAHAYYVRALEALSDPPAGQGNDVLLANVLVRLDDRARARVAFDLILRVSPAHHHARADYASALLQWRDYDEAWRVLEAQPTAPSGVDVERSGARRLDLLRLQWLTFEGRYGEAARLIETLQQRFPEDVDVQAARASFDAGRGRPADAEQHYQSAHQGAPERQDFADVLRELERQRSPKAFVQAEARGISGAWSATSTLATLEARPRPHVPVTLTAERASLTAPQFLFDDGHVAPLDARLSRFEAAVSAPIRSGTTLSAALFGSDRGAGAGTTFTHHDLRGSWKVTAERGRPFWEFVESVAGDGRKDRISVQRDWRFSADTAAWAIVDWNGYRLRSEAGAASTALTLGVIRTVRHQAPTLTLQYGLDKEHVRSADVVTTTDGRVFMPVPLTSREVHLAGAVTRFPIHRIWEVDASAGYTVDRFGGRGSFVTARATPTLRAPVGLELWGERRLYSLTTTQRVRRSGIRLTVRF